VTALLLQTAMQSLEGGKDDDMMWREEKKISELSENRCHDFFFSTSHGHVIVFNF
jgi:hypothetical protein